MAYAFNCIQALCNFLYRFIQIFGKRPGQSCKGTARSLYGNHAVIMPSSQPPQGNCMDFHI